MIRAGLRDGAWLLALLAAVGCGGAEPELAGRALEAWSIVSLPEPSADGWVEVERDGSGYTAEIPLPPACWNAAAELQVFSAWSRLQPLDGDLDAALELVVDGRRYSRAIADTRNIFATVMEPGQYLFHAGAIVVRTLDGEAPKAARLIQHGQLQRPGVVQVGGLTAAGSLVSPGAVLALELPATRGGVVSLLAALHGFGVDGLPIEGRYTARLGDAELGELELAGGRGANTTFWSLPVPDGRAGRTLEIELHADLALGAIAVPRIEFPAGRPATERPDVVLFSADTFRADNLTAYARHLGGDDPGLTPYLDGLTQGGAAFLDAWSSSSWTLPAHATMLTGLWPPQHTAVDARRALPAPAVTLAEVLRDAGWRTAAVTGGGYCSAGRGLDQGFEVFIESAQGFDDIAAQALSLSAFDDGRPLFLFVHTFRVHSPYRARQETLDRLGDDPEPRVGFGELATAVFAPAENEAAPMEEFFDRAQPYLPRMQALYRGGVAEFDEEFAEFHRELLRLGRLDDRGLLVFTSDHGEQFGENERFGHSTELWEAVLRVPLVFSGAGIEPGSSTADASLVDLMPTVLGRLGLAGPQNMAGRDLFGPAAEPELFAFHPGNPLSHPATARIHAGSKRLRIEPVNGAPSELSFDLRSDPLGLAPAPAAEVAWGPGEAGLERASAPRFEPATATVDDFTRQRLQQLGYLDDVAPEAGQAGD